MADIRQQPKELKDKEQAKQCLICLSGPEDECKLDQASTNPLGN